MRTWPIIALLCSSWACTDDPPLEAADSGVPDSGEAGAQPLRHCVDRPDQLPRPPTDRLPCELIPPGLEL